MILSSKFAKHWVIWGILMATSIAHSVKIELPLDTIILESNNGEMDKGVKVVNTKGASEGKAVDHEKGIKTVHQIDIPQAGDWYLWIRIFCPDGGKDSYWIGSISKRILVAAHHCFLRAFYRIEIIY